MNLLKFILLLLAIEGLALFQGWIIGQWLFLEKIKDLMAEQRKDPTKFVEINRRWYGVEVKGSEKL